MAIHKPQDMSLPRVILNLAKDEATRGLTLVALSRCLGFECMVKTVNKADRTSLFNEMTRLKALAAVVAAEFNNNKMCFKYAYPSINTIHILCMRTQHIENAFVVQHPHGGHTDTGVSRQVISLI